jgi:hypothetical protein
MQEIDVGELAVRFGGPAFRADWLLVGAGVVGRDECRGRDGAVVVLHERAEEEGFDDLLEGRFAVVLAEDVPVDEGRGWEVCVPLRRGVEWSEVVDGFGPDETGAFHDGLGHARHGDPPLAVTFRARRERLDSHGSSRMDRVPAGVASVVGRLGGVGVATERRTWGSRRTVRRNSKPVCRNFFLPSSMVTPVVG